MKGLKYTVLLYIVLVFSLLSNFTYAIEKTEFPEEIYIQKSYTGLTKIVENYEKNMSVTHVQTCDMNGDGFNDVILGSRYSDANGLHDAGIVYIIFGHQGFFSTNPFDLGSSPHVLKITGNDEYDYLGRCLATGDINGDGSGDLLFGASTCLITNNPDKGNAYILLGNAALSTRGNIDLMAPPSDVIVITGDSEIGSSASFGDIDGDGFDDIILGAAVSENAGASYIMKGSADFEHIETIDLAGDSPEIIKIISGFSDDCFGIYTASGDINGDGFDEVLVGARQANKNTRIHCGRTYIIWGYPEFFAQESSINLDTLGQNITVIYGADAYDYSGTVLETGNLDGDHCDDLILESSRHNPGDRPYAGVVYILKGDSSLREMTELDLGNLYPNLIKIYGEGENDYLGRCFISDVDNDGTNDILLSSQGNNESGETYLLTDETLWSKNEIDLASIASETTRIYGNQPTGLFGFELRASDVDGDGSNDLIVGTHDMPWTSYFTDGIAYILSGAGVSPLPSQSYEVFAENTGNSSTIVILDELPPLLDGQSLENGAEIGVFTPNGICAGVGLWHSEDLEITVWGDNIDTDEVEGFTEGDNYCFRTQDTGLQSEDEGEATFYSGGPVYRADDIVVLSSLYFGTITSVAGSGPNTFRLDQNYPNPFNPVTTIPFTIADAGHVELTIYDIRGSRIVTLVDSIFPRGTHTVEWNAAEYPSGVYLCRLETGASPQTRKMLLIK